LVVHAVDTGNRNARQLFLSDILQAADINAIHLADGRLIADAKRPDATYFAEEMLILPRVEQVFGEHIGARYESKLTLLCHSRPEPVPPANGTITPVRSLGEIQLCLEADSSAVAAALVRLQHPKNSLIDSALADDDRADVHDRRQRWRASGDLRRRGTSRGKGCGIVSCRALIPSILFVLDVKLTQALTRQDDHHGWSNLKGEGDAAGNAGNFRHVVR
jgi:hypothetical protein